MASAVDDSTINIVVVIVIIIIINEGERKLSRTLQCLASFLANVYTQLNILDGALCRLQRLHYGVLQGSVLGPLLFNLYTAEISEIVVSHGQRPRQNADDCQLHLSVPAADASASLAIDRISLRHR